jgi:hypothetical protein
MYNGRTGTGTFIQVQWYAAECPDDEAALGRETCRLDFKDLFVWRQSLEYRCRFHSSGQVGDFRSGSRSNWSYRQLPHTGAPVFPDPTFANLSHALVSPSSTIA